jgi:hypothetical protein
MVPVASSDGIVIHCPDDGRYAFYNSPYPAHHFMTAVDIYPNLKFGSFTPSPIDGEIIKVRRIKSPPGQGFKAPEHDTVTIIKSTESRDRVAKLLHVDTVLKEGEVITVGQNLGPLIRSGYFGYHTPLHIHIEVRPQHDSLRVRGGYTIDSLLDLKDLKVTEEIVGIVITSRQGYALIKLNLKRSVVVADVGGVPGILDGGMPIYGWFGTHAENPIKNRPVKLLGKTIGNITNVLPRTCVAECANFMMKLGVVPVDAFFVLLPNGENVMAVTSRRRSELKLDINAEVSLIVE